MFSFDEVKNFDAEVAKAMSDELKRQQDHIELIDGYPVMMAPPTRAHQKAVFELGRQLGNYLEGKKCEAYSAPFAVRPFERDGASPEDVDTMVEPDISVVCDHSKLDDAGCKGAPDLVMEILSPSTRRHRTPTRWCPPPRPRPTPASSFRKAVCK